MRQDDGDGDGGDGCEMTTTTTMVMEMVMVMVGEGEVFSQDEEGEERKLNSRKMGNEGFKTNKEKSCFGQITKVDKNNMVIMFAFQREREREREREKEREQQKAVP
ncbi:hypothetical protein RUM43_005901 [Polyplax serrata]|uniref:Uncharacterized protein n=1 Tax=Polyplax serrata TaxID=468196 RepID=A0AAN8S545_POLSC